MLFGIAQVSPLSAADIFAAEATLLLESPHCVSLKANIDVVRLAHGDPKQRPNAEGMMSNPTDAEGYRKWPKNWIAWWDANSLAITVIMLTPE